MPNDLVKENVLKSHSMRSLTEIRERVEVACEQVGYSLLNVLELSRKIRSESIDFEGECLVFELCSPKIAGQLISKDFDFASLLPCRLAVYQLPGEDGVYISSLAPSALLSLLKESHPSASLLGEEIEDDVRAIMQMLAS